MASEPDDYEDRARAVIDNAPRPPEGASWRARDWFGPAVAQAMREARREGRAQGRREGRAAERERVRPLVKAADRAARALKGKSELVLSGDTGRVIWAMGAVTDLGHALTAYLAAESEDADHQPQGAEDPDG